jgi:hypothetical protein
MVCQFMHMATREAKEKFHELKEESPYRCNLCHHAFADRAAFERHETSDHGGQQSI